MTNTISSVGTQASYTGKLAAKGERSTASGDADAPAAAPADKVSLSQAGSGNEAATYINPRTILREERPDLAKLLDDSEKEVAHFMEQLRGLIDQQGLSWNKVFSGEQKLSAKPEEIAAAKQAIADDGEWGVRKTAERILTFALGTTGGDAAKLDKVRAAVQSGFDSAREALGGQLPPISEDTYKAVMAEMDRWQKEGLPSGDTVSLAPATTTEPKTGKTKA